MKESENAVPGGCGERNNGTMGDTGPGPTETGLAGISRDFRLFVGLLLKRKDCQNKAGILMPLHYYYCIYSIRAGKADMTMSPRMDILQ